LFTVKTGKVVESTAMKPPRSPSAPSREAIVAAAAFGLTARRRQVRARLPAGIDFAISGCSFGRRRGAPLHRAYANKRTQTSAHKGDPMTNGATAVATKVPGQLTVCTYGGFAPVCYKNPAGQLIGLDVSFLTRFAERLGLAIQTIETPFDGIWTLPGAGAGACDVAGAGVMRRDDRSAGAGGSWSDAYFQVERSLLVRAAEQAEFDDYRRLTGKKIVVTKGSTAAGDAQKRYPRCTIQFVDEVAKGQPDAQAYIVRQLIAKGHADAFGEGDVSNRYLRDRYGKDVPGGLALADVHAFDGKTETFNFITRNASSGLLDRLNAFIAGNKACYAPKS
jgi:ABC-type amino acid transport substrate-binding protein